MSKKYSLEWYAEMVQKALAPSEDTEETNRLALALIKDKRLKRIDKKLLTEFLRAEDAHRSAPKDRARFATYKIACTAFMNSPRTPLIYFLKELPLENKLELAFESDEIRSWLREELRALDSRARVNAVTQARIHTFIRNNSDLPFPVKGLSIRFSADNGRIRMDLPVRADTNLRQAFKRPKCYEYLAAWRARLSAAEPPEPSRAENVMANLWKESLAGGGKKSYRDICDELNHDLWERLEGGLKNDGTVEFLVEIGGFSKAKAMEHCTQIIAHIQSGDHATWQIFSRDKIKDRIKRYGRPQ